MRVCMTQAADALRTSETSRRELKAKYLAVGEKVEALLESEASESSAAIQLLQEKLRRAKRKLAEKTRALGDVNATCAGLETTVANLQSVHDHDQSRGQVLGQQTTVSGGTDRRLLTAAKLTPCLWRVCLHWPVHGGRARDVAKAVGCGH